MIPFTPGLKPPSNSYYSLSSLDSLTQKEINEKIAEIRQFLCVEKKNQWRVETDKPPIPLACLKCDKNMISFFDFVNSEPDDNKNLYFCDDHASKHNRKIFKLEEMAEANYLDPFEIVALAKKPLTDHQASLLVKKKQPEFSDQKVVIFNVSELS